jgi:hypothetical protein
MRLRRTTWDENAVQSSCGEEAGQPVIQATLESDCLKVGTNSVTTQIPLRRLTRAGKGTTFCRTRKREGRIAVFVPDQRRSNRLR